MAGSEVVDVEVVAKSYEGGSSNAAPGEGGVSGAGSLPDAIASVGVAIRLYNGARQIDWNRCVCGVYKGESCAAAGGDLHRLMKCNEHWF
jgi:hypothetical protein